ncbi:uncharacterized protein LOC109863724 [Pseudomyrmex gracilis]|uniref:uncharacterized protein LOC109863724 n=1 Tax=Pseudomyrmex gracilis TaxID=219809 RepID=UPI000994DA05|nr:uncharacterized protein LOC109863724 [Pseudomyrmex gracilis]XP_020299787.1 uncharacterized protein LOC109863724 [Pseudomyrmex gracilis]
MHTMTCPSCRHRFSAECCQEPSKGTSKRAEQKNFSFSWNGIAERQECEKNTAGVIHPAAAATRTTTTTTSYLGNFLVPRDCTSGGGCFINATPTTVHQPALFNHSQSDIIRYGSNDNTVEVCYNTRMMPVKQRRSLCLESPMNQLRDQISLTNESANERVDCGITSKQHIATTCELTGGSVTITTPGMSDTEAGIVIRAEIQPKLTGGGCLVQKTLSTSPDNSPRTLDAPPSGCSELPGNREMFQPIRTLGENNGTDRCCRCNAATVQPNLCQCYKCSSSSNAPVDCDSLLLEPVGSGVQVRVNATVQLPANLGQCRVNITATTATPTNQVTAAPPSFNQAPFMETRAFNGGGIVYGGHEFDCTTRIGTIAKGKNYDYYDTQGDVVMPSTPVSWLLPLILDSELLDRDVYILHQTKKLLQSSGWYHEGISWQQSENILKHASVGRWLMRDSSDSRYTFAVSVQTARGPTSVRVHYWLGKFRFDTVPQLACAVPLFKCPVRMLEHYIEYSKKMDEHRKEVWVDYSGKLYSQIYLTKPLLKEVKSLSHLARLVVNQHKLPTDHLPLFIRDYLAEYPYTL